MPLLSIQCAKTILLCQTEQFCQKLRPQHTLSAGNADAPDEGGPARLHGGSFDAHQADAALGALRVIVDQSFGDVAALGGEVGQHGRHDGTVADNQRIDRDGTQQTDVDMMSPE